ncbi:Sodium/potassium-transporting ATPase subunit alpha-1 like [Quillaja saponaria]|uniref:Sodium/potassium-transporting ATPase subunit alpha-1 like n=1 Tax=Quillaja saponaria TaxID=32244 RepID=A0AAD7KR80_QUISA|nr:Sodium/potassium-transporting ATPase subunit alpha-1 like [Quillaja saponaria]
MFRALSTRMSSRRYERLGEEPGIKLLGEEPGIRVLGGDQYKRTTSLPAKIFNSSRKVTLGSAAVDSKKQVKPAKKANKEKVHPLFSIFDVRSKKKMTSKPEYSRYIQYLKEGGLWDSKSNMPVIYNK